MSLLDVYQFHRKRVPTLVLASARGMRVSQENICALLDGLKEKEAKVLVAIRERREIRKFEASRGRFNPNSTIHLTVVFRDLLERSEGETPGGGYSTDEKILGAMKGVPLAALILELRGIRKLAGTYLTPLLAGSKKSVLFPDGRIHPNFRHTNAVTGRLSADFPSVQNFPIREHPEIREAIIASLLCSLLATDYGQIEARIIASVSGDRYYIAKLRERYDVHMDWAKVLAEVHPPVLARYVPQEWRKKERDRWPEDVLAGGLKKFRSAVKNQFTFPAFYLASLPTIAGGLGIPHYLVRPVLKRFWRQFEGVQEWQHRTLEFYARKGYVETPTGRRRHGPLSPNMIVNSPIQGAASDVVVDAMDRLSERALEENRPELQGVLNVHDDLTFDIPDEILPETTETIVTEMLSCDFDWLQVPMSVEAKTGKDWFHLQKIGEFFSDELEEAA